jgi:ferrochelatase
MVKKEAIILLNMGGPNNLDEVELFLKNMFKDENILTTKSTLLRKLIGSMIVFFRTKDAQEVYRELGGKSPLVDHTKKLVKKLQERVKDDVLVDFAMRYTPPFASDVIKKFDKNLEKIYLIPLYPQYSTTTTKSSLEDFESSYFKSGGEATIVEIKHFFENLNYNKAILKSIKNSIADVDENEYDLIFSAHGLPQKIVDSGDVYNLHIKKHVKILTDLLNKEGVNFKNIHLAYQSKVGPMRWLEPSLEDKLKEIKNRKVVIFPIAFTIDNSETDYELSIEYKDIATKLGFEDYRVCRCPNDSDEFVTALVELYKKMK